MNAPEQLVAAERAVLAECIYLPRRVREAVRTIAGEDFYDAALGALFDLITALVSAYGPDEVTGPFVAEQVRQREAEARDEARQAGHTSPLRKYPTPADVMALVVEGSYGAIENHAGMIRDAAISRRMNALGGWLIQSTGEGRDPAVTSSQLVERAIAIRDGHRANGTTPRLLGEVLEDVEGDDYEWVLPGLLERGDRLILTGEEGGGKSTLLRQLVMCAAAGIHPFTIKPVEPVRALVVDCENSERQWRRSARPLAGVTARLGTVDPRDTLTLACVKRMDITSPSDLGHIHALCDEVQPDIVMIGPLYRLFPRSINSDDDAAPVLAAVDSIRDRDTRPAIVMEAHAGHAQGRGGERDMRPRGSAALMGWPEFGLGITEDREELGRSKLVRWRGDRDERAWPNALRRGGTLPWTDDRTEPEWTPSGVLDRTAS